MRKFVNILFFREIRKKYFKLFCLLIVVVGGISCYFSYKNYEVVDDELLVIETKLDRSEYKEIYPNGNYDNYVKQYEKYVDILSEEINVSNIKKDNKFYSLENIFSVQVFISILAIIIGSTILLKEYNSGTIKYLLTKNLSRIKVFSSFLIVLCLIIFLLNMVLLISYILFMFIFSGSFMLLTFESVGFNKEIFYYNYLLKIVGNYCIYMLPILFLGIFSFALSIIFLSNVVATSISIFLSLFGLVILEWLLKINFKLLTYSFIPYLDYTIFVNKLEVINFNITYGVNINILYGSIILIISSIFIFVISAYLFNKRDVK